VPGWWEDGAEMDPRQFAGSSTGHVRRIGSGEVAYWAFIPNPLPPKLTLDTELVNVLDEATLALGRLDGIGSQLSNPYLLIRPFTHREALLSSRIEGTQAELTDLLLFHLDTESLGERDRDVREVMNLINATEYALHQIGSPGGLPMSLRLLREVHRRLLHGVRGQERTPGEFRRSQNWIGPPGCLLRQATFIPPPAEELPDLLGNLERYIHQPHEYPPLVRAALVHYQFEAIHPFQDGNGRIGRLLIVLCLLHWKVLRCPLLWLSAYFERHRDQYYDHLLAVSQRGAWREWLMFFLRGVYQESVDALRRVEAVMDLQQKWRNRLLATRQRSAKAMKMLEHLFVWPAVTIPQVQGLLGVSYRAAKMLVERLIAAGILTRWQPPNVRPRPRWFVAGELLEILAAETISAPLPDQ
jgi:Fic family protein